MPDPAAALAGNRILVVEDVYLIAMELKRWLQAAGAEVAGPAADVVRALDLIERWDLDAAVLDVSLAGHQVYRVADQLGAAGVPYLFATGNVAVADAYGQRPRIAKPFKEAETVRAIGELLAPSR